MSAAAEASIAPEHPVDDCVPGTAATAQTSDPLSATACTLSIIAVLLERPTAPCCSSAAAAAAAVNPVPPAVRAAAVAAGWQGWVLLMLSLADCCCVLSCCCALLWHCGPSCRCARSCCSFCSSHRSCNRSTTGTSGWRCVQPTAAATATHTVTMMSMVHVSHTKRHCCCRWQPVVRPTWGRGLHHHDTKSPIPGHVQLE